MTKSNPLALNSLLDVRLKKLTMSYSSEQDRLLLLSAGDDRENYGFWITRNLLKLLIDHLVQKFSSSSELSSHDRVVKGLMLETLAQSAVQERDKSTPPVSNEMIKEMLLIISLDITLTETAVSLIWRSSSHQFVLNLSHAECFQWLAAMRTALKAADWAINWPDWVVKADISEQMSNSSHVCKH